MFRKLLFAALLTLAASSAQAATCFWVGGTGTWDNSTDAAHWDASSGGAGSDCAATGGVPKNAGDIAVFDASSGGGTVTVAVNISIAQITCGAFTGTLDFATNDNTVALTTAFDCSGTGTRTINMGDGTWTITSASGTPWTTATTTNLTFNANSSTVVIAGTWTADKTLSFGGVTLNNLSVTAAASTARRANMNTAWTVNGTFSCTNVQNIALASSVTYTMGASSTWSCNGVANDPVMLGSATSNATISTGAATTMSYMAIFNVTKAGAGSLTATDSFDLAGNSGWAAITNPTAGGARGGIFGG
jgi:hypothetical protein